MLAALGSVLAIPAGAADLIATHNDWKAYRHDERGERMCFATSAAVESQPRPGIGARTTPYVYVTTWPRSGIKTEISIHPGVELERGAEITVDISGNSFTLVADGDRAFVGSDSEEIDLLNAMRRGRTMTVEAVPSPGKRSKHVFSLVGLTASLQAATSACN